MFSKSIIIVLFCVAGLIDKCSNTITGIHRMFDTPEGWTINDINPNLDTVTDEEWLKIFEKHDIDNDGSINLTQLQNLLYEKFKVFLTIDQAEKYIHLIDTIESNEITLEQLKKMKLMIYILSQRFFSQEEHDKHKNKIMFYDAFVHNMRVDYQELFPTEEEFSVLLKLVGLNENQPNGIKWTKYDEIFRMVEGSVNLDTVHSFFVIETVDDDDVKENSINDNGDFDFLKYIRYRLRYEGKDKEKDLSNLVKEPKTNLFKRVKRMLTLTKQSNRRE